MGTVRWQNQKRKVSMFDKIQNFIDGITFIGWYLIIAGLYLSLFTHKVISIFKEMKEDR